MRSNRHIVITGILMALLVATSSFAETIKLGLPEWGWGYQGFTTMDDVNDVRSTRFTAYEDVTVDRVMQYFYNIDSTDTRLRIGIQCDSEGVPSGTWLNSAGHSLHSLQSRSRSAVLTPFGRPCRSLLLPSLRYVLLHHFSGQK